jgi:cytoskeletal protein RodZ
VDTSTSVRNSEPTGDESNADKSTGKSSETNVGAIVGGVLGGIALIALIGFGIWFIRFQKRKGAKEPEEAHPYVGLTEQSPANQPYPGTEYTADTPKSDFSAVASPATAYQPSYPAQAVEAPAGDHAATMHQPMSAHHPGYQTQLVEAPDDNNKRAELM